MKDQRPTWLSAILWLIAPLGLILTVRWLLIEPYVIPSGSMIPNLLIHDHIVVNKLSFGVRVPFQRSWLINWTTPQRGDIIVFRYPENPEVFYVKRLIGLPGDKIEVVSGTLKINGEELPQKAVDSLQLDDEDDTFDRFQYFEEAGHLVRYLHKEESNFSTVEVPENSYFMMGDNRDQSSDSRSWGFVPRDHLIGKPIFIWLSCSETLESAKFLCDPAHLRWDRIFKRVQSTR